MYPNNTVGIVVPVPGLFLYFWDLIDMIMFLHTCMQAYMYEIAWLIYMYVYVHTHKHIYSPVCVVTNMHVCSYTYERIMHIHTYIHTYIHVHACSRHWPIRICAGCSFRAIDSRDGDVCVFIGRQGTLRHIHITFGVQGTRVRLVCVCLLFRFLYFLYFAAHTHHIWSPRRACATCMCVLDVQVYVVFVLCGTYTTWVRGARVRLVCVCLMFSFM